MQTIDINQALTQIVQLFERVSTGEEIIITKNDQPIVKLVSIEANNQTSSVFENDQNIISVRDDFDKALKDLIEKSAEQDKQLTSEERSEKWLAFVQNLPQQSANLPDEALHRDTMYD